MYGKIFKSIYDGTLADDWRALITFQQMIILCDADGILDMTPLALQKRTGIPIEHIKAGIEILEAVDIYSRSKENEGRRIERIDPDRPWGWVIINHTLYKNLRTASDRREYMRKYMKDIRETKKLTKVNKSLQELTKANCKQPLTVLANTDTDKDKDTDITSQVLLKPKKKNKFSLVDKDFAKYMFSKIQEINPSAKSPNLDSWANEVRLMREVDNRIEADIQSVFNWANSDPFWRSNILSPAKLRKQFDQLIIKSQEGNCNETRQRSDKPSLTERATEAREQYERGHNNKFMGTS